MLVLLLMIFRYGGFAEVLGGNKLCVFKRILVAVPLPSTPTCCNAFHSTHPTHKTIPSQNAAWMSEAYSGTMRHKVLGQTHAYNVPCQVNGMRVGGGGEQDEWAICNASGMMMLLAVMMVVMMMMMLTMMMTDMFISFLREGIREHLFLSHACPLHVQNKKHQAPGTTLINCKAALGKSYALRWHGYALAVWAAAPKRCHVSDPPMVQHIA